MYMLTGLKNNPKILSLKSEAAWSSEILASCHITTQLRRPQL